MGVHELLGGGVGPPPPWHFVQNKEFYVDKLLKIIVFFIEKEAPGILLLKCRVFFSVLLEKSRKMTQLSVGIHNAYPLY